MHTAYIYSHIFAHIHMCIHKQCWAPWWDSEVQTEAFPTCGSWEDGAWWPDNMSFVLRCALCKVMRLATSTIARREALTDSTVYPQSLEWSKPQLADPWGYCKKLLTCSWNPCDPFVRRNARRSVATSRPVSPIGFTDGPIQRRPGAATRTFLSGLCQQLSSWLRGNDP